jgi:predicted RNase H-like HicB family nuclease
MAKQFDVVVERDSKSFYVASVPSIAGCHKQARSLDELMGRIREAIGLCLEVQDGMVGQLDFVGVQRITV